MGYRTRIQYTEADTAGAPQMSIARRDRGVVKGRSHPRLRVGDSDAETELDVSEGYDVAVL